MPPSLLLLVIAKSCNRGQSAALSSACVFNSTGLTLVVSPRLFFMLTKKFICLGLECLSALLPPTTNTTTTQPSRHTMSPTETNALPQQRTWADNVLGHRGMSVSPSAQRIPCCRCVHSSTYRRWVVQCQPGQHVCQRVCQRCQSLVPNACGYVAAKSQTTCMCAAYHQHQHWQALVWMWLPVLSLPYMRGAEGLAQR